MESGSFSASEASFGEVHLEPELRRRPARSLVSVPRSRIQEVHGAVRCETLAGEIGL